MKKSIWMTSLGRDEAAVMSLFGRIRKYGLEVGGHFWEDDNEQMAWIGARAELIKPEAAVWVVVASPEDLEKPSARYGLSALSITVQAQRGGTFPVVLLHPRGKAIDPGTLPTPLRSVDTLAADDPGLGAKLVAKAHTPSKAASPREYRLDVYGNPRIGQWFEIGPNDVTWKGAMAGVCGSEIAFHGVGASGMLPSRSTLEFPVRGMKIDLGGKEYVAWAVENEIGPKSSYFIKVTGAPDSILFGPYASGNDADAYVVTLK
jgi:hypothetical protein